MNTDYPMPVAETASTFNEVHLGNYALSQASPEEKLALLESDLRESTQCIMDIYSRYLFETDVFDRCRDQFYNFPYAFGNLFAVGLYALYLEQPDTFMDRYKAMLRETPVHTIEENGAVMGIDLTDRSFWIKSLELLKDKIDTFCSL